MASALGAAALGSSMQSQFDKEVRNFSNVIGGGPKDATTSGTVDQINWHEYNYPPCLRLVHYDAEELRV